MDIVKFIARRRWWAVAILAVFALAACGPAPLGVGWPAVSLVDLPCGGKTTQNILVAYSDRIVMVNPVDGKSFPSLNQDTCQPRLDDQGKQRPWDFRGGEGGPKQFYTTPIIESADSMMVISYEQHIFQVNLPVGSAYGDKAGKPIPGVTGHTVADVAVTDDTLYIGLGAKNLVALDRKENNLRWEFSTGHGVWAKPLVKDDVLYFSSLDHNLYAVDAKTGQQRWVLDLQGAATSTPVLYNDKLYIASFGRKVFEIALDGKILNEYAAADWIWSSPVIVEGILYTADLVGNVYALDADNKLTEIWKHKIATGAIRPTPLVVGDVVIVASRDQKIYWLNRKDGTPVTSSDGTPLVREIKSPIFSDVLLVKPSEGETTQLVVVGTTSPGELLVAYTLDKGEFRWNYALQ